MTIKELKEKIEKLPDDMLVFMDNYGEIISGTRNGMLVDLVSDEDHGYIVMDEYSDDDFDVDESEIFKAFLIE